MYKLGTLEQFEIDNSAAKKANGWTQDEIENGKVITSEEGESSSLTSFLDYKKNPNNDEYLWESPSGDIEDEFNILATWGIMRKPPFTKYYIANNNGFYIFGKAEPKSWPSFGSKVVDIEIFDTEKEYLARVEELGIITNEL